MHPLHVGQLLQDSSGTPAGRPRTFRKANRRPRNGRGPEAEWETDFRAGTCTRAGSREGGHISTLGNPTGGIMGELWNPKGSEMAGAQRQKAHLPGRPSGLALPRVPQHRASSSAKARGRLVTARKFQALPRPQGN